MQGNNIVILNNAARLATISRSLLTRDVLYTRTSVRGREKKKERGVGGVDETTGRRSERLMADGEREARAFVSFHERPEDLLNEG